MNEERAIAIVGMGCHFPGGAHGLSDYWALIRQERNGIVATPPDRWSLPAFRSDSGVTPGKTYSSHGGFLQRPLDEFDASFFGFSASEAAALDPQQRLLLETSWETLESGVQDVDVLRGSDTGVFVGGFCMDNQLQRLGSGNRHLIDAFTATSSSLTLLANRLSHFYDFQGPSIAVDTACSSSLVALQLACQSIRNGECSAALVGGANCMIRPEYTIAMSKGHFLSHRGRSMPFDESADGYVRGEGAGMVYIKPLEAALAAGDPVHSVILATGVNQDGATSGITLPNPEAQASLIERVIRQSGLEPANIKYLETHGTGTQSGDAAEFHSLTKILNRNRTADNRCWMGCVKALIGHLEAAAGIASVIKTALILKSGEVPAVSHVKHPNPTLDWEGSCLTLPSRAVALPPEQGPWFAGINSFGYGGTNAHVILKSPPFPRADSDTSGHVHRILPISAGDQASLRSRAVSFLEHLKSDEDPGTIDRLIACAAERQAHLSHRIAVHGNNISKIAANLESAIEAESPTDGQPPTYTEPVFVFSGMGTQWVGMGQGLKRAFECFDRAHAEACEALADHSGWHLDRRLHETRDDTLIHQTCYAQPAIFALQWALSALLADLGIRPAAVMGHSAGEIAASAVAGQLSLDDAALVCTVRSRLQQRTAGMGGGMLAVGLAEESVAPLLRDYAGVVIAAVNSPGAITLSGDSEELGQLESKLPAAVFRRFLRVDIPYHSPAMDELRPEIIAELGSLESRHESLPIYSTVTGTRESKVPEPAEYWWANVRQPVRFIDATHAALADGRRFFVEVGAHPVLQNSLLETLLNAGVEGMAVPTLRRDEDELSSMGETMARLYVSGCRIAWGRWRRWSGVAVPLPPCPRTPKRYWLESESCRNDRLGSRGNPFLFRRVNSPTPTWEVECSNAFFPFVDDHRVNDAMIFPAAGFISAAVAVHCELFKSIGCELGDWRFHKMLRVNSDSPRRLFSQFDPDTSHFTATSCSVMDDAAFVRHASGSLRHLVDPPVSQVLSRNALDSECGRRLERTEIYELLKRFGLDYGPEFRRIEEAFVGAQECTLRITSKESLDADSLFDPRLLDAVFHGSLLLLRRNTNAPFVPVAMSRLTVWEEMPAAIVAKVRVARQTEHSIHLDIGVHREDGTAIMAISRLECARVPVADESTGAAPLLYRKHWVEHPVTDSCRASVHFAGKLPEWAKHSHAELQAKGIEVIERKENLPSGTRIVYFPHIRTQNPVAGTSAAWFAAMRDIVDFPQGNRFNWLIVTDATHYIAGDEPNPPNYQVCIRGTSAVLANEGMVKNCGSIDLDFRDAEGCSKALLHELSHEALDREVSYRGGIRRRAQIHPIQLETQVSPYLNLRPGAYVVTGGMRGFGLRLALWLARNGADHLVLASRSGGNSPEFQERSSEFEALGVQVEAIALDVSVESEVSDLMNRFRKDKTVVRGIFHAAMVLEDGFLSGLKPSSVEKTFAPKTMGAHLLHRHSLELDLDHFVMLSSVSPILGNPGQAAYSAANTFLDELAHYRHRHGLQATSINLGLLRDAGVMKGRQKTLDTLMSAGVAGLTADEALDGIGRAINSNLPQVGVFRMDWRMWRSNFTAASRDTLLSRCFGDGDPIRDQHSRPAVAKILSRPAGQQKAALTQLIGKQVAPYLKASGTTLDLDSLSVVELVLQLNRNFGVGLGPADFAANPGIPDLADLVLARLREQADARKL